MSKFLNFLPPLAHTTTILFTGVLDTKGIFGITCPGYRSKFLVREALPPTRPSPREPSPRTREDWGVKGATSLPATTGGPARARGPPLVRFLPGLHQVPQPLPVPWQPTLWVTNLEEPLAFLARARGS